MEAKAKRALSVSAALRCETAMHARCRCRCGGLAHGAARITVDETEDKDVTRALFAALPVDDPHHLPTKEERKRRGRPVLGTQLSYLEGGIQ